MDMTGWIEFFAEGLSTQMQEMVQRGERAIRRDVLAGEHSLSKRQARALGYLLEHGQLRIKDYQALCPKVDRRSLQRDLKAMIQKGLVVVEGATNRLLYKFKNVNELGG